MIITVGGVKGGTGKTTIAVNLAIYLNRLGHEVLLVDADEQETATNFTTWREDVLGENIGYTAVRLTDHAVRQQVLKLQKNYQHVVIDAGGRDTTSQRASLFVSDIYLMPFNPRSFDVWTIPLVEKMIKEVTATKPTPLHSLAFINKADSRGADNDDTAELLSQSEHFTFLDNPIINRKAFSHAAAKGLGVLEFTPADEKANQEINSLFQRVLEQEKLLT